MLLSNDIAQLNFGLFTQVAHHGFEGNLGIVLGNPLDHRLLLRVWQSAGFHFIQRQQNDVTLHIGSGAEAWLVFRRQSQAKRGLADRVLTGTAQRFRFTEAQASRFQRVLLTRFQIGQNLLSIQFRLLFRFVVLNLSDDLILHFRQRFDRFWLVLADAQHKRTIAIDGNDV